MEKTPIVDEGFHERPIYASTGGMFSDSLVFYIDCNNDVMRYSARMFGDERIGQISPSG